MKNAGECQQAVVLCRLLLGACCEVYAATKALEICTPGCRNQSLRKNIALRQLSKDASLAAVWTSAHAQYLHDLRINKGMAFCMPTIHTFPCEVAELNLADLYAHRLSPSVCPSKDTKALLSLLMRCTNPGSRGWDGIVSGALNQQMGTRRVCSTALAVSLLGMHSAVHPAHRMDWRGRLALWAHLQSKNLFNLVVPMCSHPLAFKECLRRLLGSSTRHAMATNAALVHLDVPSATLSCGPLQTPSEGLQCSSMAFVNAGKAIAESKGHACVVASIQHAMHMEFLASVWPRPFETVMAWNVSYMGKGTSTCAPRPLATFAASSVWSSAFKTNFIPFWVHSHNHGVRAARTDACQHEALLSMNAATSLVLELTDEERMDAQRLALASTSAGIMTLTEVKNAIGIRKDISTHSKEPEDVVRILRNVGGFDAARMLQFCRTAATSECILVYDLGVETKTKQVNAVIKRLLLDEYFGHLCAGPEELVKHAPEHATHILFCTDCRRVVNAVCTDAAKKPVLKFNELGTNGTMTTSGVCGLRCARRLSASHKIMEACEAEMTLKCVDSKACDDSAVRSMLTDAAFQRPTGTLPKLRRDSKACMDQLKTHSSCGSQNLLKVPILGKAVRLWGNWYTLCSFCGCFVHFKSYNKYHSDICCLKCDYKMLNRNKKDAIAKACTTTPQCRFCGKVRLCPRLCPRPLALAGLPIVRACSSTLNVRERAGNWSRHPWTRTAQTRRSPPHCASSTFAPPTTGRGSQAV